MGLAIAFWAMAAVMIIAAVGVVFLKNVFRAALSLILCFLMVAGIYITLTADFLAAVQILVYVGAISVLIILGIMMTREVHKGSPANKLQIPGAIVVLALLAILVFTAVGTDWNISSEAPLTPTTNALATSLFSEEGFLLPVEIAAVLLLAAILGAIVIAREKDK